MSGGVVAPSTGRLRPLGLDEVRITGGYWGEKQELNAGTILAHCLSWMERIGWVDNFDAAAATDDDGRHAGVAFVDSEVYKLLEAMGWELGRRPDAVLQRTFDGLVDRVAAAQRPDGYLHTAFGRPGLPDRYTDLEWGHELYCFGHLIQAAVARLRTGHDDRLVAVARAVADHVWREFGPDGRSAIGGHPEIEPALAEFSRATGEPRYLELARLFIERRGRGTLATTVFQGHEYFQDDVPVREAAVLRGHAVRALYLSAGAVDVAVETGDDDLLAAVRRQWDATVARRTYITGGMGAHHQNEEFGDDFELPDDRAYSETCAGVGSVMLSWRLLLQSGEAKYADLIERTLFNTVMASPREDGCAFFYTNTLHQRTRGISPADDQLSQRAESSLRAPWFEVSCCPTNVARTLAGLASYVATADEGGVQLHQYADAEVSTSISAGAGAGAGTATPVRLRVRTDYPRSGEIVVEVLEAAEFTLSLRVPDWARDASGGGLGASGGEGRGAAGVDGRSTVSVSVRSADGTNVSIPRPLTSALGSGYVAVRRAFAAGDVVMLSLPMQPRVTHPSPRIDAVRGTVAVERGPVVLCLESADLPEGLDVDAARLVPGAGPESADDGAVVRMLLHPVADSAWPYGAGPDGAGPDGDTEPALHHRAAAEATREVKVALHPYAHWGNRGPSTMRVWIPLASDR